MKENHSFGCIEDQIAMGLHDMSKAEVYYKPKEMTEDIKQYEIRSELEKDVEIKALGLFQDLFALNMIHNGGTVFGDNRKTKNIKLEKALRKYLNL